MDYNTIMGTIIIVLSILFIYHQRYHHRMEHMAASINDEAIQNLASIYKQCLIVSVILFYLL